MSEQKLRKFNHHESGMIESLLGDYHYDTEVDELIRTQQATIDRLTAQLYTEAEKNAKLVSEKYPFAHIMIDCSEYEKDLAIRNKLIDLGWTPPAEIEASK